MRAPDRQEEITSIDEFKGVALDAAPKTLPPDLFQRDFGGDRFDRGTWRRRRGMIRTNVEQVDAPITVIIGTDLPGSSFSLLFAYGECIAGTQDVINQPGVTAALGYGKGVYGKALYGK